MSSALARGTFWRKPVWVDVSYRACLKLPFASFGQNHASGGTARA
jgi:hypothetical protein